MSQAKKWFWIALSFIMFFNVSCLSSEQKVSAEDITGAYLYIYPSKEVEVLFIYSDSKYTKDIYSCFEDFENDENKIHYNQGAWYGVEGQLNFTNWLLYTKFRDPKEISEKPQLVTLGNVYWIRPNKSRTYPLLTISEEYNYEFKKIGNVPK
jgi:hypothetical protein